VYFYPAELSFKIYQWFWKWNLTDAKLRATFGQIASIPNLMLETTYFNSAVGAEGYGPVYDSGAYNDPFNK
jgi:hypothetical protein